MLKFYYPYLNRKIIYKFIFKYINNFYKKIWKKLIQQFVIKFLNIYYKNKTK